jgi:hypothetical protein
LGTEAGTYGREGRTIYVIPLPGRRPASALSPNGAHGHWSATAKARRVLKAAVVTRVRQLRIPTGRTHLLVELHYVTKDRRTRDADNLVPVLKPCLDALTARKGGAGIIADDTPDKVTWRPPVIHDPDKTHPRLWLEVTDYTGHKPPSA